MEVLASKGGRGGGEATRWTCQSCKHSFAVAGADAYAERLSSGGGGGGEALRAAGGVQASSTHGGALAASRMDHSFVVLPKQRNPGFPPPRPRSAGGAVNYPTPGYYPGAGATAVQPPVVSADFLNPRTMDGSFVVLPSSAASMYRPADGVHQLNAAAATNAPQLTSNAFNASVNVLTRVYEIASAQTQVDQPLCIECMRLLSEELDKEVEEATRDVKAYEACLERLEKEQQSALTEEEFMKEKMKIEEEDEKLEDSIEQVDKQHLELKQQLEALEEKTKEFEELEQRYWHNFNDFKLQVTAHQEERDAVLAKIDVAQAQLAMLKKTNVLSDAFHISYEGDFGTINNFRLGRLPNVQVEWDEINAAWGQACLLLYTMAQYCQLNFTYRIIPMGSYPCIADSKNTYELYGPVNLFWSTRYDRAMEYFLACLREFADFANAKDRAARPSPEKCFELPYKIENDKVAGYSIKQSFNRQDKWTKALKFTVCNLKWALYWLIGNTVFQPGSYLGNSTSSSSSSHSRIVNANATAQEDTGNRC